MASLGLKGSAIITGAGGALGRAIAQSLARHGVSKIGGLDISTSGLDGTKNTLAEAYPAVEFLPVQADLASADSTSEAICKVISAFGRIDYAINNAGVGQELAPSGDTSVEEFDRVMNVNFRGLWLCEKYELRQMEKQEARAVNPFNPSIKEKGSIVNVSSVLGFMAMPHLGVYNSSKHATLGLTRTDAIDYAKKGIRVNTVAPGFIDTPLLLESTRKALKTTIDRIPQGRLASPEEVADAVTFLLCGLATHITGVTLPVDGGFTAT
ncbi:unnamed protein product [Clonostachys rosea]|uniref:Uncharacterized protein n=1 Tax=Bionectria ochroleuca TaxID=29856 RepID=A0ABY6U7G8_BIOOC|nr:unnamed protein product [Clonostachys rosea]